MLSASPLQLHHSVALAAAAAKGPANWVLVLVPDRRPPCLLGRYFLPLLEFDAQQSLALFKPLDSSIEFDVELCKHNAPFGVVDSSLCGSTNSLLIDGRVLGQFYIEH